MLLGFILMIIIFVISWVLAGYVTNKYYVPSSDKKKEDPFDKFD